MVRLGTEHILKTARVASERKHIGQALQRSEREFRELAESMPQIVWATTADGLNTYFNQQWVDYTGLTLNPSCRNQAAMVWGEGHDWVGGATAPGHIEYGAFC